MRKIRIASILAIALFTLSGCYERIEHHVIQGVVSDVQVTTVTHWFEGIKVLTKITFEDGRIKYCLDSLPDKVHKGKMNVIPFTRYYHTEINFTDKLTGPTEFPE